MGTRNASVETSPADDMHARNCAIAAHCDVRELGAKGMEQRLRASVQGVGQLVVYAERADIERAASRADCVLLVIPWIDSITEAGRVERIRRRAPEVPIIVVTSKSLENTRRAVELGFTSAVWMSDVEAQLAIAIRFALQQAFLRRVARNAESARHLPPAVRAAVVAACRSRAPVRSLEDLAALAGVHRTALLAAWQACSTEDLTPKRLLDWVLLLHATARKTSENSWSAIAGELCASEDTLSRLAVRLLKTQLSGLNASTIEHVRTAFTLALLTPLGIRMPVRRW